jgi:hypothetical protein
VAGPFCFLMTGIRAGYDPRRPDFIDVAGGFPVLTGGAGGGCCTFVTSGTPCACCGPLTFFFEKSGISFFLFIESPFDANAARSAVPPTVITIILKTSLAPPDRRRCR